HRAQHRAFANAGLADDDHAFAGTDRYRQIAGQLLLASRRLEGDLVELDLIAFVDVDLTLAIRQAPGIQLIEPFDNLNKTDNVGRDAGEEGDVVVELCQRTAQTACRARRQRNGSIFDLAAEVERIDEHKRRE